MTTKKKGKKAASRKLGRPKLNIKPTDVEKLASEGLTDQQLAAKLGISARTLRNRKRDDPKFLEAYQRGEAMALAEVEQTMFKLAKAGDSAACRFILSTRRRDIYTTRQELSNPDGEDFRIAARPLTAKERKAAIVEIHKALESDS